MCVFYAIARSRSAWYPQWRKGRSFVAETGHTVILGWSPQIFAVVAKLMIANANRRWACIAILADQDQVEMEDELRARVGHPGRTRIVCRTGNPMDLTDLAIVNPHHARAIIVLAPDTQAADARTLVTLLHLRDIAEQHRHPFSIVSEMLDVRNRELAKVTQADDFILSHQLTSLMLAQVSENKSWLPCFRICLTRQARSGI